MSKLLSLDQSSHITGYAIFDGDKLIAYDKFTFDSIDNIDVRLVKIRNKVQELLDQYSIDEVIFEDIQLQNNVANNVQTFKILAEVYGIIAELLEERKIPHSTVFASSWKTTLKIEGSNRTEQKRNAQKHVLNKYGIKPTQDECDAICIGEHYILTEKGAW